jgi:hypothetical protein
LKELELYITIDHELFGNASGDLHSCMIDPALQMCAIAEESGARITFFVDVCMYWAFVEAAEKGVLEESYRPHLELEEHLKDLVRRGHDVQLHLHPQWLRWKYLGEKNWDLDLQLWRLPEAMRLGVVKDEGELFARGKRTLEDMLKPVKAEYECIAFRAGAWSIQPEADILKGMAAAGLKIDSTVAYGMKRKDSLTQYDFTACPDNWNYRISDSLASEDLEGPLEEWPITTVPVGFLEKVSDKWRKSKRQISGSANGCSGSAHSGNKLDKWIRLLTQKWQMLSLDGTDAHEMIRISERAIDRSQQNTVRLIMIGHSKNFGNPSELKAFLKWVKTRNVQVNVRFREAKPAYD